MTTGLQIVTGSVHRPPEEAYPRLLVMRRWPRGLAKGSVDQWERELGPATDLLAAFQSEAIAWDEFDSRYRGQVEGRPELLDWVARMAATTGVVLLCSTHEPCHRDILADLVRGRGSAR